MAKQRSKAELQAENTYLRRQRGAESWAVVLTSLIKWGAIVALGYFGFRTIETLAGKTTIADVFMGVWADVRVSKAVAWILATAGCGYGYRESKLRRRMLKRLGNRIKDYETEIDPGRSSSGLTESGDTHPADE